MNPVPTDLAVNQKRKFTGPDDHAWWAWRDREGKLNYMPEAPEGELEEHQVCITVELVRTGAESWAWVVTASGPLDAGDPIAVPPLDEVLADLDTAEKAFGLGWRAWMAYLDANRRCPFCGATFEIATKDLDGTIPAHKHAKDKADEIDGDGNCLGSGQWVEDLMGEGIYTMPSARQLLDNA